MSKVSLGVFAAAWFFAALAIGAEQTEPNGDAEAGKKLATEGAGTVTACASCHGANGEGQAAAGFPRLAGSSEYYLRKQLNDYTTGQRSNPIMQPVAKAMSLQQIADVAAFYVSLKPQLPAPVAKDGAASERGRMLAARGDESKQLQACASCHGPEGIGLPPAIPALAGQPASYLKAQLQAWKQGTRKNDDGGLMGAVAAKLDDADVDAVAEYYSRVRPVSF